MTLNLGMVRPGSTILIPFNAFDSNDPSASVIISDFALADIGIYKGTSMTERASTSGVVLLDTDGIDIDGAVGIHGFSIDLADNDTAGYFSAGSHYYGTVGPITIDGATVNFVAVTFSIGYPDAIINTTIASVTDQTQFILTDGPAEADVLIGCPILFHDVASAVQLSIGYITDYIVTTKEVFIAADPGGFTFVATDNVSIFMPANVRAVGGTLQTAGDLAALINTIDDFLDTEIAAILVDTGTTLQAELDAIQAAVITNATGADIAADIIAMKAETVLIVADTNELQTDWVDAGRLDLIVDEILVDTGTTLDAALAVVDANVDQIETAVITNAAGVDIAADVIAVKAETALIVADTDVIDDGTSGLVKIAADVAAVLVDTGTTLDGRIPAALVGGRMDADMGAISTSTDAADKLEASAEVIVIGAAEAGTLSTTQMTSDLAEDTDDHYNGRIIIWTSGVLIGQATDITDYAGATGLCTFTAVTEAPSAADTFIIV